MKAKHKPQGIVTLRDGSKKPIYHRGCSPASLANLQPQRRGQQSHGPNGRRGNHSFQSEMERLFFNPEWERWKQDMEKTQGLVNRVFLKQFGITADEALERAYGYGRKTA
jgi:hypothetical protein